MALVRELLRGEYLDKKENVLFIGNPGAGKTYLICALAFSAFAQGWKGRSKREAGPVENRDTWVINTGV